MLAATDAVVLLAVGLIAGPLPGTLAEVALAAAVLGSWLVLAKVNGLYDRDHRALRHLTSSELPSIISWVTTASAGTALVLNAVGYSPTLTEAARLWVLAVVAVPLARASARRLWRQAVPPERVLIVGRGPLEVAARRKLELFDDIHAEAVGVVDDAEWSAAPGRDELAATLDGAGVDRVLIATRHLDEELVASLLAVCRERQVKLSVVPPARGMFGTTVQLERVADLPLIQYATWDVPRSTLAMKRAIDITVSALGLALLLPLFAAIAIAIRLDSRGPLVFVQQRAGRHGRPFRIVKFRTMVADAQDRLPELVDLDALIDPVFKIQRDPRVTRVGRLLRRTSLDELPQLINVLLGHMSLVGPRPEELALVDRYRPEHRFRLELRPGMTGPMQVYGRAGLRFDERLAVERDYIEHLSLSVDLRILLMTASAVMRGEGAT